jgi:hypothetical protein
MRMLCRCEERSSNRPLVNNGNRAADTSVGGALLQTRVRQALRASVGRDGTPQARAREPAGRLLQG